MGQAAPAEFVSLVGECARVMSRAGRAVTGVQLVEAWEDS